MGNARAQSGAVDGDGRQVMGDRGGCFWFSSLSQFGYPVFLQFCFCSFDFPFIFLILLFLCMHSLGLSRFGGMFVMCGSLVRSSVRFCGRFPSSGWSERFDLVSFVHFIFILFGTFVVCGFRWRFFRSGLVLVGICSFFA